MTAQSTTARARAAAAVILAVSLAVGLLSAPALADPTPAPVTLSDRAKVLAAWKAGGPAVRRGAETALAGPDQGIQVFLATGQTAAAEQDLRAQLEQRLAVSGPGVRAAGAKALAGPAAGVQAFLDSGYRKPFEDDQRVRLSQIMATGGPGVRVAAGKAMDGTADDVTRFLNSEQFTARDNDDRVRVNQLMSTGGPEVKKAAGVALDGTVEDVREFLRAGWQVAAARDQETLTVAQLADLAGNSAGRAGEQSRTAKDAAAKAVDAARLAKDAAQRAAQETKAAQGDAVKAAAAAGRAADAAGRAAVAAQTASTAATAANEAAQQAANAAAAAAAASTQAGDAAAAARKAAADAATDAGQADAARAAAAAARQAATDARSAGEAAAWAGRVATEAGVAAQAAADAGTNAAAAAQAAADAAQCAGVSGDAATRANDAATKARTAAAEATRAATATVAIAAEAAAAAGEAQRAANAAAGHADAAAAAATAAAAHAGEAATAATTAQAAATEATAAADAAAQAATQAHKIADTSRKADAERLVAQEKASVAAAVEAKRVEDEQKKTAAWQAGQAAQLAADTERLLTEATATGVDPAVAVTKGRQAAVRLLTAGGPWVQAAAETALAGTDADVRAFLSTGLTEARDRDDRVSVMTIAYASTRLPQRLAAEQAAVGTPAQVREFLSTGAYPGKDDDDRVLVSQIMAAGSEAMKAAGSAALDSSIAAVREFLTHKQYEVRDDDNAVLINKAIHDGGPEVNAVAQAVLSGPKSGYVPFLQIGLPKAQRRDADTAAHVATIGAYLNKIDGSVAVARQYAAEAARAAATARGAATEAAGYANQAQISAGQAAEAARQAAASALQAQASAKQAADYARTALANAASARDAARRADNSATAATASAQQAKQYAIDAKAAADQARASAEAAGKSSTEANQAADAARQEVWNRQQAAGAMQNETAFVDEDGRVSFVDAVPRPDMKQDIVHEDMSKCTAEDPGGMWGWLTSDDHTWHKNAAGVDVCDVPVTVKVSGTVDYVLKTCPVPNLSIAGCQGKYTEADTLVLASKTLDGVQFDATSELTYKDYVEHYQVRCDPQSGMCMTGDSAKILASLLFGDLITCIKNPGVNGPCAWAVATFIPWGTLLKGVKGVIAVRYAVMTGIGIEDAQLVLRVALGGYTAPVLARLDAMVAAVTRFRGALANGEGLAAAYGALRGNPNIDARVLTALTVAGERTAVGRAAIRFKFCARSNSFSADTQVLMADGTARPIATVALGDLVLSTDPVTGVTAAEHVTQLHVNIDIDLADIAVALPSGGEGVIRTTQEHPFWDETRSGWVNAGQLVVQHRLRTDDGRIVTVVAVRNRRGPQEMRNLTVADLHTYYVLVRGVPVLVHNTGPCELAYSIADHSMDELKNGLADHYVAGIEGREALAQYVDDILFEVRASVSKPLNGGRVAYWDDAKRAVVIENPLAGELGHEGQELGTVFTPERGKAYYDELR
ncbi:polymorphic toxin-type HINT domain-containing protein [Longispora fulva]|uniref:Uncharacterized protein n=2 Tax=Longispora fulva TaxID=619741 RepID=A0A8J7GMK8_9ACTN|nr:polymorphic toxin-type HINT domain-containing protein [Longispora fulva]MBG6135839.1 hypothetical protein [Longispora fulva]